GGTQPLEGGLHRPAVAELLEEAGDDENDNDGGGHQAQGGDHRPEDSSGGSQHRVAAHVVAHIGGHIHPHGAGGGLGHGDHGGTLLVGEPAGGLPHVLEEGDGGQSSADGEQSGFEKLKKQAQEDHFSSPPLFCFPERRASSSPVIPASTTSTAGEDRRSSAWPRGVETSTPSSPPSSDRTSTARKMHTDGASFTVLLPSLRTLTAIMATTAALMPARACW